MKHTSSSVVIIAACIIGVGIISGVFFLMRGSTHSQSDQDSNIPNVQIVEGKQIITIKAKGGYQPRKSIAKAAMPTIVRFDTKGTFDCSAAVRIPSMNINQILPQTGTTDIDLGSPKAGVLQGTCGMGMYPFEIDFQ